jgi:hypothetical protein
MKAINIGIVKAIISQKMGDDFLTEGKVNNSKNDAKKLLNIVKNSPVLQLEFKVFDRLENKTISSDIAATRYIDNNLSLFENYSQEEIETEHQKLKNFVDESVAFVDQEKYELYKSIGSLISETLNKKNPDVDLIHESFTTVLGHIKKEKPIVEEKTIELPTEIDGERLIEHALDKFTKKYESLNEEDLRLIKNIVLSSKDGRKSLFESLKTDNISLLESTQKDGMEDKIHETIDRINKMQFNNETSIKDIMSLHELKSNMS